MEIYKYPDSKILKVIDESGRAVWVPDVATNKEYRKLVSPRLREVILVQPPPRKKPEVDALIEELAQRLSITPEELRAAVESRR